MVPVTRVRLAVVGLGGIAQSVHLPLVARRWDLFELTALADLSADRAARLGQRYGVPVERRFADLDALLAAVTGGLAVDGVVLATSGSHGDALLRLARAGLPVLCEKPVALSVAEVDAVEQELRDRGRDPRTAVLVGYMKEYDPAVARARAELAGRRVRAVTVEVLHPADDAQLRFARLLPPAGDVDPAVLHAAQRPTVEAVDRAVGAGASAWLRTTYTNVVLGSIVHDVSLLRHLVGGVTAIDSAAHWGGVPGSVQLTGHVGAGARLHLAWHFIADYPDYRETITVHHEQGSVSLTFAVPYLLNVATELVLTARAGDLGGEARTTLRWAQEEAFENELAAFHAMVTEGAAPSSGLAEGRADLRTGQRVLAALARARGEPVAGEAGRP